MTVGDLNRAGNVELSTGLVARAALAMALDGSPWYAKGSAPYMPLKSVSLADGSSSVAVNRDGTGGSSLWYECPEGTLALVYRLSIACAKAGAIGSTSFGGFAAANGVTIDIYDTNTSSVVEQIASGLTHGLMLRSRGWSFNHVIVSASDHSTQATLDFEGSGGPKPLTAGQRFRLTVNDDWSSTSGSPAILSGVVVREISLT